MGDRLVGKAAPAIGYKNTLLFNTFAFETAGVVPDPPVK
jgi:hypothetical protein